MAKKKAKLSVVGKTSKSTTSLTPAAPAKPELAEPAAKAASPVKTENKKVADDTDDMEELWLDPELGVSIADTKIHAVPFGKPKNYFRVNPDPKYMRRAELYVHKPEGQIEEEVFIVGPQMRGRIEEARPCIIVTCMYRDKTLRLWALMSPREDEKDKTAWSSARAAARDGMKRWVKLIWSNRAYKTKDAKKGYPPEPDWSVLPSFNELVRLALGEHGIIRDPSHPAYRDAEGYAPPKDDLMATSGDADDDDL